MTLLTAGERQGCLPIKASNRTLIFPPSPRHHLVGSIPALRVLSFPSFRFPSYTWLPSHIFPSFRSPSYTWLPSLIFPSFKTRWLPYFPIPFPLTLTCILSLRATIASYFPRAYHSSLYAFTIPSLTFPTKPCSSPFTHSLTSLTLPLLPQISHSFPSFTFPSFLFSAYARFHYLLKPFPSLLFAGTSLKSK